MNRQERIASLEAQWQDARWNGITREHTAADVIRLQGSFTVDHSLARMGAMKLWDLLETEDYVHALGAISGGQAVQMAKAGLKAIYLSGWQVAGDANEAGQVYPDQSLYPANSGPSLVKRINNALTRADEIEWGEGNDDVDYMLPIVADAEAGFGGALNVYELTKAYIGAGAAAVHLEDQLASEKKCGHMGGKVLVPTSQHVRTLKAARLAADVSDVPTLVVARTDSLAATLLTSETSSSPAASGLPKASTTWRTAWMPPSPVAWPTPRTQTSSGARHRSRTWKRQLSSPTPSMPSTRASCSPTTARHRSTGRQPSTTPPSPRSRRSWAPWATGSSSSRWPASMR